jgi:hypothetical protein
MDAAAVHFNDMRKKFKMNGSLGEFFPDRPRPLIEHGSRLFQVLEQYLLERGVAQQLVERVCGANFKNFLIRSLPQT